MGLFYGVRGIIQGFFKFRFPEGYLWPEPPIPSLLVPYGKTSDFYFSGHCGFLTLILCELHRLNNKEEDPKHKIIGRKFFLFYLGGLVYVALILLIYNGHYSIGK